MRVIYLSAYVLAAFVLFASTESQSTTLASEPQAASTKATTSHELKTLKERLSDKASDEQRVDNCKVPFAQRGTKVRPDSCTHTEQMQQ